jgi:ankyrin repeat protein
MTGNLRLVRRRLFTPLRIGVASFVLFVAAIICGSVLYYRVQGQRDGSDKGLLALAKGFDDTRTAGEIRRDNAFIRAAEEGNVAAVRSALRRGAMIDARYLDGTAFFDAGKTGYTALMLACARNHQEVVEVLLEAKPDLEIECRGKTSLCIALVRGNDPIVDLLVEAGAKEDPRQMRLTWDLTAAACRGFEMRNGEGYPLYPGYVGDPTTAPTIADVVARGADVNLVNGEGYTALMYAANLGLIDNVKELLAKGADATRKSKYGETALSLAERPDSSVAREERAEVVELLKAHLASLAEESHK